MTSHASRQEHINRQIYILDMVVGLFYTVSDIMLQYGVEHVHDLAVVDHLLVEIVAHTQFNQSLQDQVQQLHRLMADVCVEMLAKEGNRNSSNSRCTAQYTH